MRLLSLDGWWDGPLPQRSDLGARYPVRAVMMHSHSRALDRKVACARRVLDDARGAAGDRFVVSVSGGKDSVALAAVVALNGLRWPMLSMRDRLCWPGEDSYLQKLSEHLGLPLEMHNVDIDPAGQSLLGHTDDRRQGSLSAPWFRAVDKARAGRDQCWGLRRDENKHRGILLSKRGPLYQRKSDGCWTAAPLRSWSALDVHAMLYRCGIPIHPVYRCVEPHQDPMMMRHSWWVVGGEGAARHYAWLRRWWPELWDTAVAIDPEVRSIA